MTAAPAPSPQQIRDRLLQAIDPQSNVSTARRARGSPTGGAGTPSSGRSPAPPPPAEGTPGAARPPPPPLLPPGPRRDALLPGHRKPPLRAVAGSSRLRARPRSGSRRHLSARSLRGARGSLPVSPQAALLPPSPPRAVSRHRPALPGHAARGPAASPRQAAARVRPAGGSGPGCGASRGAHLFRGPSAASRRRRRARGCPRVLGAPGGLRRWIRGTGVAPAAGSLGLRFYPSLQSANELICSFWDVE